MHTISGRSRLLTVLAALLLATLFSLQATVPALAASKEKGQVFLDFKDIPLPELIKTISELTGKNFLYDDRVRGSATIISPQAMTPDEAYQLFLAVLDVKGFSVVPVGKTHKIIPTKQAVAGNVAGLGGVGENSDRLVTQLVRLHYVQAEPLAETVLSDLVPKTTKIVAYTPLNRLIISDSAANIDQIVGIIRALDVPDNELKTTLIQLKNADAESVAKICNEVLELGTTPVRRRRQAASDLTGNQGELKILPYTRTNTLIIKGDARSVSMVRTLASQLDAENIKGRSSVNVYYLENADAETLAKTLQDIIGGIKTDTAGKPQATTRAPTLGQVSITADKATNSLIIGASPEDYDTLKGLIKQLDLKRKQVFVEALILELSMDATEQLGASLQGAFKAGDGVGIITSNLNTGSTTLGDFAPISDSSDSSSSSLPSALAKTINGIMLGGLFNPISVVGPDGQPITVPALSALIDLSRKTSDINILSAPRLLTSDNEEAEIIVGRNVPIITSRLTDTGGSTGLAQSVSVERKDVALTLRLTPQITEGQLVKLNVYQEITDLSTTSVGNVDQVGPTFTKRLVRNTVVAADGRTVVLGGLISNNQQVNHSKVPLLGDIPVLGWLFKSQSTNEVKTNLLIFVTPYIVRSPEELAAVSQRARQSMRAFQQGKTESFAEPNYHQDVQDTFKPSLNSEKKEE